MARPTKVGLDYFELDCHIDDKVKLIQAEFGLKGFAVIVKLLQKIYGENGYYCEWNEDVLLLFMSDNGLGCDSKNFIEEVVSACIRRNIFSESLFKKFNILTSSGVQKRYLNATSKREKVELKKEYLLVSVGKNKVNVVINSINDGRNSVSDVGNTQSRVEKSREEKSKDITVSKDTVRQTQNVQRVVEEWNKLSDLGITTIFKLSADSLRYKMLVSRIKQYDVDTVIKAIGKIRDSNFLQGGSKKGWVITFDWFVRPNNFPKVLEGNYDDKIEFSEQMKIDFEKISAIYPIQKGKTEAFEKYKSWINGKFVNGEKIQLTNRQIYIAVRNYVCQQEQSGTEVHFYKSFDKLMDEQLLDYVIKEKQDE